jgi:hypothetical protein
MISEAVEVTHSIFHQVRLMSCKIVRRILTMMVRFDMKLQKGNANRAHAMKTIATPK